MNSRLAGLLALMTFVGFGGCASFQDISHQNANHRRARQEFNASAGAENQDKHYRDGWQTGYVDVASGSGGKIRPFAPGKYFSPRYQNPEGEQHLANWTCGYQAGVAYALETAAARYQFVPTLPGASLPKNEPLAPDWYFANVQGIANDTPHNDPENIIKPIKIMPEDDSPEGKSDKDKSDDSELPKPNASRVTPASIPAAKVYKFDAESGKLSANEPAALNRAAQESVADETETVQTVPLESVPTRIVVAQNVPVNSLPAETTPSQATPSQATPVQTVPIQTVPAERVPIQNVPIQNVPIERVPVQTVPIERVPVQNVPMERVPISTSMVPGKTQPARLKFAPVDVSSTNHDPDDMGLLMLQGRSPANSISIRDKATGHATLMTMEKDSSKVFPASVNMEEGVPRILRESFPSAAARVTNREPARRFSSRRTAR